MVEGTTVKLYLFAAFIPDTRVNLQGGRSTFETELKHNVLSRRKKLMSATGYV